MTLRFASVASALSLPAVLSLAFLACGDDPAAESGAPVGDGGAPAADGATAPDAAVPVLAPCAAPTGAGTEHKQEISADETWTAAASPHRVTYHVRMLAKVTLEPCAVVEIDEGYTLTLGTTDKPGSLVGKGERGVDGSGAPLVRPVVIRASDPAKPWGSISVSRFGALDLENAELRDGANPTSDQNGGGVIVAYGNGLESGSVAKTVRLADVTIDKARGYGVNLTTLSAFTADSRGLTVKGSGRPEAPFPVRAEIGAIATVPPGLTVKGNVADEVEIVTGGVSMLTDTIKALGPAYRVNGRLRVAADRDGAVATLTIEPGVTIRFDPTASDPGIHVGSSDKRPGSLVAVGTADKPITFTSAAAAPAPGDWKNIWFSYMPPSGSRVEHAVIEYAGGPSGAQGYGCGPIENDASMLILTGRPEQAFVKSTTFRNGGGDTGIILGWTSDQSGPDFLAPNTFVSMPACKVSRWRSESVPACPGDGSPVCL